MRFGKRHFSSWCIFSLAMLVVVSAQAQEKKKIEKITYDDHVRPILQQKCFSCHNQDKKSGDLDLTNYTNLMLGGGSGEVVEPGDAGASYLYLLVTHESEPYMPPESPKMATKTLEVIRKWIDGGALENKGSKANIKKKPKVNLAMAVSDAARPKTPPMPAKMSLEPWTQTAKTTAVSAIATNPWSKLAAIGSLKQVLLYRTDTAEFLGALEFPEGIPQVLKFSRNGQLLLAGGGRGGASGRVVVWDIKTTERIITVGEELDAVLAADISSDHSMVALGGPQKVVRIYSTETGQLMHELRKHTDWIYNLEFSPDGVLLATGDRSGNLFVWEGWTGREYLTLKGHGGGITGISWRSDSNVVASGSLDGTVRLWEMENGGNIKRWTAHGGGLSDLEFARDGRIASIGRDRVAKLWDQNGKQLRAFEAFTDLGLKVSFCDESNRLIGGDWTGQIRLWEAKDGKRIAELAQNPVNLTARLKAAEASIGTLQKTHAPIAAAFQAAEAAWKKAVANEAAMTKQLMEAQAAVKKLQGEVTATTKSSQAAAGQLKTATDLAKKLEAAQPVLKDLVAKAAAAAKQVPSDKELAAAAKSLTAVSTKRAKEFDAAKADVKTKTAAAQNAQKAMVAKQAELKAMTAKVASLMKALPAAKAAVVATKKKYDTAKVAFDKSAGDVKAAVAAVARWKAEMAFATKLSELSTKRKSIQETLQSEEDVLIDALTLVDNEKKVVAGIATQLQNNEKAMKAAMEGQKAALAKVETAKNLIATRTKEIAAIKTRSANLTKALPTLQQSRKTAAQAAGLAKEDKELAQAAQTLAALVVKKQKELTSFQTALVTKDKEMKNAAKAITAESKLAADMGKAAKDLQTLATKLNQDMKTKQSQVEKAIADSEIIKKKITGIEQQLTEVKKSIATLRGLN